LHLFSPRSCHRLSTAEHRLLLYLLPFKFSVIWRWMISWRWNLD